MKKFILVVSTLVSVSVLAFSNGTTEPGRPGAPLGSTGIYTFGGSTTVSPIAFKALEAFMAENPKARIAYESVGSSTGIKQLAAGVFTLAGSSRLVTNAERATGLYPTPICLDGLSMVVNKSVTVTNLSISQIRGIYSGLITNWKEVGGVDATIVVINRDETSGTYAAMKEMVLDPVKARYRKDALVAKENGEVAAKVTSTPHAIGYSGMAFLEHVINAGGRTITVDGVEPTAANVLNKTYPLSRNLFLVTKGPPEPGTVEKAFIDFVLSEKGQAIVKAVDYIPLPKN